MIPSRPLRILILEDNPDHAELIVEALKTKDENFDIQVSQSKAEFMKALASQRFDAFLIDYHLPDSDGLEILEEIHAHQDNTPVIFISGTENEEVITQVLHAGAADFIVKSRTSLKTLPIVVKRNIIRKMTIAAQAEGREKGRTLLAPVEDALKRVANAAAYFPMLAVDELQRVEELLERTTELLKAAKRKMPGKKSRRTPKRPRTPSRNA